jgi:hypothetical protein
MRQSTYDGYPPVFREGYLFGLWGHGQNPFAAVPGENINESAFGTGKVTRLSDNQKV